MVFSSVLAEYLDFMAAQRIKQFYNFYILNNFME